jgi:hypothetical protein
VSRGLLLLDRVVLLLLGVVVITGSALLLVWGLGRWPGAPTEVDLGTVRVVPEQPWWPWAVGVGGAVAVLVGLIALVAHARRRRVRQVALPASGHGPAGRLRVDLPAVAAAAAEILSRSPQVLSARGHLVQERGTTVLELLAKVDASADLDELRATVVRTRDELAQVLPAGTVQLRVRLDVRRSRVENARVA